MKFQYLINCDNLQIRTMQNQRHKILQTETFNPTISSPTSITSSTFYNVFSPRYSSIPKNARILYPTSSTNIRPSECQNNHILSRNLSKQLTDRQQTPRPESVYKNHQTKHLLNRIRYLQGIIKEKDRRYKQQQSSKYNKMQSSQSTTSSTYNTISFLAQSQSQSSKKIFQLEEKIKELQKTNKQQKMQYQRKIQQMQEHMATHFVEIESEIMDQEWMGQRTRDLQDSIDQASLKKGVYLKFDNKIQARI